jgi:YD repeat-containing protein
VHAPTSNVVKVFTTDAFGNLTQVLEDPSGLDYATTYSYDLLYHLTNVAMTRSGVPQPRSFSYTGNNLTSTINPENGTVSYTDVSSGNGIGKVAQRTDAKGQVVAYTYDLYSRLSEVQRYPSGISGGEDTCQREVYYYDGATPSSSSTVTSSLGHLSAMQYWGGYNPTTSGFPTTGTCDTTYTEAYTYSSSSAPISKQLTVSRGGSSQTINLSATFSYDNEGRMRAETYPTDSSGTTASLSYAFDSMGRSYSMTDVLTGNEIVQSASYGPANERTGITGGSYPGGLGRRIAQLQFAEAVDEPCYRVVVDRVSLPIHQQ